jgi:hypothetical protein
MVDQKSCIWGTVVVALVVRYTYFGRNLNMSWTNKIFRSVSLEPIREKQMPAGKSQSMGSSRDLDAQAGVQKLRQAHDLAKVSFTRRSPSLAVQGLPSSDERRK